MGQQETASQAEEVKQQAQEKAGDIAGRVQSTVRTQVDERTTQAGEQLSTVSEDLRKVGEQLGEDAGPAGSIAQQAADRTERLSSYLNDADADRLIADIEDFSRRQPWLVLAGAAVLGFGAARFLKASSADRYHGSSSSSESTASTQTLPASGQSSAPPAPLGVTHDELAGGPLTPEPRAAEGTSVPVEARR